MSKFCSAKCGYIIQLVRDVMYCVYTWPSMLGFKKKRKEKENAFLIIKGT